MHPKFNFVCMSLCYTLNISEFFAIYYTCTLMLHNDYDNNHLENSSHNCYVKVSFKSVTKFYKLMVNDNVHFNI